MKYVYKFSLLVLATFAVLFAKGQCENTSSYGSANLTGYSETVEISTCNYESEYNTISGILAGETYESTSDCNSYITVRSGSSDGPVVAHGQSPLTWTATTDGDHFIHYNTDASCGTASSCCTTTITCTSCPAFPEYNMTDGATETTCEGNFYDPEGTGTYNDFNGSMTMTFCSGTGEALEFDFTTFSTTETADNLEIYDGSSTADPLIGTYSETTSPGVVTSSGTCLTFVWTTDNNGDGNDGWEASISCIPPPPANDDCTGAELLSANPVNTCDNSTAGTVESATDSGVTNSCTSTFTADDVWYSFEAQETAHMIEINNASGSYEWMDFAVYEGSCGSLTEVDCFDTESGLVGGLNVGSTV
ncbi:MAG: CUB domain-containing protein [Bacteroidales bacterium]